MRVVITPFASSLSAGLQPLRINLAKGQVETPLVLSRHLDFAQCERIG
jgi:hypothetical protein